MPSPPSRRRRGPERPLDLEDMDPREGLWAFAHAWLQRAGKAVEEEAAQAPIVEAPAPEAAAPPKKKRAPRRDLVDLTLDFRRRALAWITRPPPPPAPEPKARKRVSRPPSAMSLRERAFLWIARPAPLPPAEPKKKRAAKTAVEISLRERAFAWLGRPRKLASAEPRPRRRVARAATEISLRERAFLWLGRALKPAAPEPRPRRRAPRAHAEIGLRRRAFLWLTRLPAPKPTVVEAPPPPVIEAPPPEPTVAAPKPEPRRKRAPKVPLAGVPFHRRAFTWITELGPKRRAQAEDDAIEALSGEAKLAISEVARTHLKGVLEALIFASESPLPARELARLARADIRLVKALLVELVAEYHGRGFRLDEVAGGFLFRTSPAFAPFVREQVAKKPVRMSRAQIETLAIVAYRQPITRPEVDDVRGVDSGAVLKSLLERDLVRILGKKDEPGRPMLYGTTADFLSFFGLKTLGDLPTLREFTELSDDSRRTYEREMGEEPPDDPSAPFPPAEGLMGGEGSFQKQPKPTLEQLENMPEDMVEPGEAEPTPPPAAAPAPDEDEEESAAPTPDDEGSPLPDAVEEGAEIAAESQPAAEGDEDDEDDDDEDDDDEDDDDEDDDDDDEDDDDDDDDEDDDDDDDDEDEEDDE